MGWITQHLPVWTYAKGVTQGSGKMLADAQVTPKVHYWNMEGPLEMPKVEDMNCSTPVSEDLYQVEMPNA